MVTVNGRMVLGFFKMPEGIGTPGGMLHYVRKYEINGFTFYIHDN